MAKILVMEDCTLQSMMLSDWLELDGHEVQVAQTGAEALKQLQEQNDFDLLITDMYGGEDNDEAQGLDLITAVRNGNHGGSIDLPIVSMSGVEMDAVLSNLTDNQPGTPAKSDEHFVKPIDLAVFSETIAGLIVSNEKRPQASAEGRAGPPKTAH